MHTLLSPGNASIARRKSSPVSSATNCQIHSTQLAQNEKHGMVKQIQGEAPAPLIKLTPSAVFEGCDARKSYQ